MTQTLEKKIALVTGGSRGIGAAIAQQLAADGAKVAITYAASPDKADAVVAAIKQAGGDAFAIKADSGDAAQVKSAVDQAVKKFGKLDILVNNAGIAMFGPLDEMSGDDVDRIIGVNVKGVILTAQAALPHLNDNGRIINIGSVMSDYASMAGASLYVMSKGAVAGFTRGLAREAGARGITVNNVQPGPIDTDMNPAEGDFAEGMAKATALGHYGKGKDIGAFVSFLASDAAGYITGADLLIDGGFAA